MGGCWVDEREEAGWGGCLSSEFFYFALQKKARNTESVRGETKNKIGEQGVKEAKPVGADRKNK